MNYRVIKENDLFFLTDESGQIPENHPYGPGLYSKDTRFLSKFDLKINGESPILLSSEADNGSFAEMILTNPHMVKKTDQGEEELILWRESVELHRSRFIYEGVLYEEITATNYYPKKVNFDLSLDIDADFADMFIVRGFQNGETGHKQPIKMSQKGLKMIYQGADDVQRKLEVDWNLIPEEVTEKGFVRFNLQLEHMETSTLSLRFAAVTGGDAPGMLEPVTAKQRLMSSLLTWTESLTKVHTSHQELQRMVDRGLSDLRVLLTDLGQGSFPVAGLPWFGVPFGRDSIIAALQMLPFQPDIARGTLRTMANNQGKNKDSWRDEEPGKIMHEIRFGELANTGQIPFTPYYGTIDATPLFLVLLSEYVKWTGDTETFKEMQKNVEDALTWIDQYGDRDGDGFVEYHQEASKGIANQGWKDSGDSIVHRDGSYAASPIALSEVQGYVYQAKSSIAEVFEALGQQKRANDLRKEAAQLKQLFQERYWMEDQSYYALALDYEKKQAGTVTSNPGHVLMSGMLEKKYADAVSNKLISPEMFSGFGIRTMGEGEAGYNPMSYHNGTVWPHDNSLIFLGMSKTGNTSAASKVINGLIQSAASFEYDRLPELFCGYSSVRNKVVNYPVACSPQAWAAGTPLLMIQAMLGLFPDVLNKVILINPVLPDGIDDLTVSHIRIAKGELSVKVTRQNQKTVTEIMVNTTGCEVSQ